MTKAIARGKDVQDSHFSPAKSQFGPRAFSTSGPEPFNQKAPLGHSLGEVNLLHRMAIQPKLIVGPPDDKYEKEADRVAEQVMRMAEPCPHCRVESEEKDAFRAKPIADQITYLQREVVGEATHIKQPCGQTSQVCPRLESGFCSLKGSGQPLPESALAFFEPRFGHDFGRVRVHADSKAAKLARALNSHAFTVGRDIVFGAGEYAPGTIEGRQLLAHELTHVMQQRANMGDVSTVQRDYDLTHTTITPEYVQRLSDRELENQISYLRELLQTSCPDDELFENLATLEGEVFRRHHAESLTDQELDDRIHFLREHAQILGSDEDALTLTALESEVFCRSEAQAERLRELLDFTGPRGWHHTLTRSNLRSIAFVPARSRVGTPRLGGRYPRNPSLEPISDSQEAASRQMLINDIRRRLSAVHVPTGSGQLGMWHTSPDRWGYAYRSRDYTRSSEASAQHQEFLQNAELGTTGLDPRDPRVNGLWDEFRRILTQEGDTSAINAYDEQIVTIGSGFSARSGDAGWIYNRMPLEFRQRLYEYGICVNSDNTFTVLDLERGVVETGDNALRILQVNPSMLGVLIQESQSQTEMEHGGMRMASREWMLRSQFERFMERNRMVPNGVFSWDPALRHFAFRLRHWMTSVDWRGMAATNGDMNALANYALTTIYNARLRSGRPLSVEYIQDRIRDIANDSGLEGNNIVFRAFPHESTPTTGEESVQPKLMAGISAAQVEPAINMTATVENQINSLHGMGHPLPASARNFFEAKMGHDFREVRIHDDSQAIETARLLNAKAFAIGRDIVFGTGQYSPGTRQGNYLLAHELTHVIQQQGGQRHIQRLVNARPDPRLRPDAQVCLVHLHADERNALAAAENISNTYRANLVKVLNPINQRCVGISNLTGRRSCMADPNRIFGNLDTTKTCAFGAACPCDSNLRVEAARDLHASFRPDLIEAINQCRGGQGGDRLDTSENLLPIIAFHNNDSFNVGRYRQPEGDATSERWAAATENEIRTLAQTAGLESRLPDPIVNPRGPASTSGAIDSPGYYRNFFLTTRIEDFLNLGDAGYNVVLQSPAPRVVSSRSCTGDDGSLSIALRSTRYINIEIAGKQSNASIISFNTTMAINALDNLGIRPIRQGSTSSNPLGPTTAPFVPEISRSPEDINSVAQPKPLSGPNIGQKQDGYGIPPAEEANSIQANQRAQQAAQNIRSRLSDNILIDMWGGDCRDNNKNGRVDSNDNSEQSPYFGGHIGRTMNGFNTVDGFICQGEEGTQITTRDFRTDESITYSVCARVVSEAYRGAGIPVPITNRVHDLVVFFQNRANHTIFWPINEFHSLNMIYLEGDFICSYDPQARQGHSGMVVQSENVAIPMVIHLPGTTQRIWSGVHNGLSPYDPTSLSDMTLERWPEARRSIYGIGRYLGRHVR